MAQPLDRAVVVVTGASAGVGRATALAFARRGGPAGVRAPPRARGVRDQVVPAPGAEHAAVRGPAHAPAASPAAGSADLPAGGRRRRNRLGGGTRTARAPRRRL